MSATPNVLNYGFNYWVLDSVNVDYSNPTSVTMNTNHALTAFFGSGFAYTNKPQYSIGEIVTVGFQNTGPTTITLYSSAPWVILDALGSVVYSPIALQYLVPVLPGQIQVWYWNQIGSSGLQVSSGTYTFLIGTSIGSFTATFSIGLAPAPWVGFVKPSYPDYAPSGMPDFDQKQDNWMFPNSGWTWCGPVSVADSLWWLDSEYESIINQHPVPPAAISDSYSLVTAYGPWDDHDPQNVGPLVTNLSWLMDTDGMRTGLSHTGTFFTDMQAGISQYLAQQGLNPYGDCDGNGVVDYNDVLMLTKAFNSRPGSPNFLACDINHDNKVDIKDILILGNNLWKVGQFYEHTVEFPSISYIENETYACEDVVLLLEFWQWDGATWTRYDGTSLGYNLPGGQAGHYVTVAGVNSTASEILISDPFYDAFEGGMVPGQSPFPHAYPHNADVHNDTHFVSHDAYWATPSILSPPLGYGAVWELPNYLTAEGFNASWHAFIRAAVVTSHQTIVPAKVESSKDSCGQPTVGKGYSTYVNATIINEGLTTENLIVTVYANSTVLGTTEVNNVAPGANVTVTVATWNTTTWAYGDYFLTAVTNASDRTVTGIPVRVVLPGDVNGDGTVDLYDAILLAGSYGEDSGSPTWNPSAPNADINCDNIVDLYDAIILAGNFGKNVP